MREMRPVFSSKTISKLEQNEQFYFIVSKLCAGKTFTELNLGGISLIKKNYDCFFLKL